MTTISLETETEKMNRLAREFKKTSSTTPKNQITAMLRTYPVRDLELLSKAENSLSKAQRALVTKVSKDLRQRNSDILNGSIPI
jgi:hypothetical protein